MRSTWRATGFGVISIRCLKTSNAISSAAQTSAAMVPSS